MKLRILCLHGYRQDGEMFSKRIGSLRKVCKAQAEFVFMDAPLAVLPGDESGLAEEEGRAGGRGWWVSTEDDYFRATLYSDYAKGLEESVAAVEEALVQQGPFDGLLGFSQGAATAVVVCALKDRGQLCPAADFSFVILVAAFKSRASVHAEYYSRPISTPSLHVIGAADKVIESSMSEELAALFTDCTMLRHDGGHFVPATSALRPAYATFMNRFAAQSNHAAAAVEAPKGKTGNTETESKQKASVQGSTKSIIRSSIQGTVESPTEGAEINNDKSEQHCNVQVSSERKENSTKLTVKVNESKIKTAEEILEDENMEMIKILERNGITVSKKTIKINEKVDMRGRNIVDLENDMKLIQLR